MKNQNPNPPKCGCSCSCCCTCEGGGVASLLISESVPLVHKYLSPQLH